MGRHEGAPGRLPGVGAGGKRREGTKTREREGGGGLDKVGGREF